MPNGTYGGVRGRKMKVGGKLLHFPPTRFVTIPKYLLTIKGMALYHEISQ